MILMVFVQETQIPFGIGLRILVQRESEIPMKVYDTEADGESFVTQEGQVLDTWKDKFSQLYNVTTEDFKFNDDFKNFIMNEKYQLVEEI